LLIEEDTLISFVKYPIEETTRVAPSAFWMLSEKLPSMSVIVPVVVPLIRILAPMSGSEVRSSVTVPETDICAHAIPVESHRKSRGRLSL
jgi:hypothetical protein